MGGVFKKMKKCTDMTEIIAIEKMLFEKHKSIVKKMEEKFFKLDCEIVFNECWTVHREKEVYHTRPPKATRFIYWLDYVVLHKGKPLIYDDENSPIQQCYGVLQAHKELFTNNIIVEYSEDTTDLEEDLNDDFLLTLETLKKSG